MFPGLEHPPLVMAAFFGWAALGALIAGMCKEGRIALPRITHEREPDGQSRTYLDVGFLSTVLLGGLVGMLIDGRPATSLMAGISVAFVGRDLLKPLVERFVKERLGVPVTFDGPAATDIARETR